MSGPLPYNPDPTAEDVSDLAFQQDFSFGATDGVYDTASASRRGPRPAVEPAANPKRQKNREAQR
jgi:hypothetical protein